MSSTAMLLAMMILSIGQASADEPMLVDPHDFTRTPCKHRIAPCPGYEKRQPAPTDNTILDSGRIQVRLASGAVVEVVVYLVGISPRGQNAVMEKRVIVEYESSIRDMRSESIRQAVFDELIQVPEAYGVDRADIAACRPSVRTCKVSSFVRRRGADWVRVR